MLTLKLLTEETERVVRGLEKKHFQGAREAIEQVIATDKKRREAQQQLDKNLADAKKLAAQIGQLMKQGQKDEAEAVKESVAAMKETNKQLEQTMNDAQEEVTRLLCRRGQPRGEEQLEGMLGQRYRGQLGRKPHLRH